MIIVKHVKLIEMCWFIMKLNVFISHGENVSNEGKGNTYGNKRLRSSVHRKW